MPCNLCSMKEFMNFIELYFNEQNNFSIAGGDTKAAAKSNVILNG